MTAEEIKAEAAERIARAEHSKLYPGMPWESVRVDDRAWLLEEAADVVHALGDMLPTWFEERGGGEIENFQGQVTRRIPKQRRYLTDWQEVTE